MSMEKNESRNERIEKTSKKRKAIRLLVVFGAVILAALFVLIASLLVLRSKHSYTEKNDVYVVISGAKVSFEDGVSLEHKKDQTVLKVDGQNYDMEDFPLISDNENTVLFQKSGSWNRTDTDKVYRMDYFTYAMKEGNTITVTHDKDTTQDVSGFLYDNEDVYLFLEPVTLTFGDECMELPEMTIVHCQYMEYLQIYGPDMEPFFTDDIPDEVMVTFKNGKRVNVASDRYYQTNGVWRLLFLPLDILDGWK